MHLIEESRQLLNLVDRHQFLGDGQLFANQPRPMRKLGEDLRVQEVIVDAIVPQSLVDNVDLPVWRGPSSRIDPLFSCSLSGAILSTFPLFIQFRIYSAVFPGFSAIPPPNLLAYS